ncbi:MAG: HlyD family efflux transporter periplasmic adaptor subunit [Candidatus Kapabacteria bacterium]|nr:HlyD family efflux transporter periplasmic adaptor subunit [Ignavibacteriota bacterium]MCW5885106.1 HlyD family efflux transporter periplasmic adaptor subunit [Candidatus Kapabacteria bacterium]
MLNISKVSVADKVEIKKYYSFSLLRNYKTGKVISRILLSIFIVFMIIMFLPWTQNVRVEGYVGTLNPDQKPQTVNSIIGGKIVKWYVREGDYIQKGDKIVEISEIKDEYFDPKLLERVASQIQAKKDAIISYEGKINALENRISAVARIRDIKVEQSKNYFQQTKLKVQSDSIDLVAANTNFNIAKQQLSRMEELFNQGLKSLTDLEQRRLKIQDAEAKLISATNKLLTSQNELINAEVEISSQLNQYSDNLAKAESERWETLSKLFEARAELTKMENMLQNYEIRSGMYIITAPQNGFVARSSKSGIGEIIKEGDEVISIAPSDYDPAIEMYISPMDLPLMKIGQKIRIIFDGWPSIVFSGWPDLSIGTFGGEVVGMDYYISSNGKYRILIAPDPDDAEWPDVLRIGSGAMGMILLNDVPIWYETWRQFNGFPPDFYNKEEVDNSKIDKNGSDLMKPPGKSLK